MLQEKIARIQSHLVTEQQDYLLIGNFNHQIQDDLLYWLLLETLEYGIMLIPQAGKPILFAIPFEINGLMHKREQFIDILPGNKPIDELLRDSIGDDKKTIAIHLAAFPALQINKLSNLSSLIIQDFTGQSIIREQKLPKEIERLQQAAKLTDIIFSELLACWHDCYTEADVANSLLCLMAERGVEPSFPPIVASGVNAANPHHHPAYKPLQRGFCVIDFGVRFKGYCSDMTRTIYLGTPNEEEKSLYLTLLKAQEKTIEKIMPKTSISELDMYCRKELGKELSENFIHSLGHGIGTQVHELPAVNKKSTALLQEHMIITIEPGIYVTDMYGMRIEDDVLVTETGYQILTKSEKTLIKMNYRE